MQFGFHIANALKLLVRHGRRIVEILLARSHLAQGIILINPAGTVGLGSAGSLIRAVVGVTETHRGNTRSARGGRDQLKSVQQIILFGRRHKRQIVFLSPFLTPFVRDTVHQGYFTSSRYIRTTMGLVR